ncbi:DNA/RNA non-specific endonuclease [Trypanosoma melophagium]|uniref:DNA/RNA non-specific endonuclease n=1 Tax=Trypanosoma melophagium TaxID=715481 RepID=UPI00351A7E47|nr:DNA/RNA non-specific endonuclease [Trypanosoma melophagium]
MKVVIETGRCFWNLKIRNPTWLEPLHLREARAAVMGIGKFNTTSGEENRNTLLLLSRCNYALLYDTKLRMPLWCGFYLTRNQVKAARRYPRSCVPLMDRTLPEEARVTSTEMQKKNFEKGHMAPHASVASCNKSRIESSLLSNFVLQHKIVNRGVWKRLEHLSRSYVMGKSSKSFDRIYKNKEKDDENLFSSLMNPRKRDGPRCLAVSTGVLFNKEKKTLDFLFQSEKEKKTILVPDELYLALWDVHSQKHVSFIIPNDETVVTISGRNNLSTRGRKRCLNKISTQVVKVMGLHDQKRILKKISELNNGTSFFKLNRFRVELEELERRITASESLIEEKLFPFSTHRKIPDSFSEIKEANDKKNDLLCDMSRVELFPLQKRNQALRKKILRIFYPLSYMK